MLLAPVSTVGQAAQAAAAGARMVDVGADGALIPRIRRELSEILICGDHETADVARDAYRAARTGAALICPGQGAAAAAVERGIAVERILLQAAPAGIEAAVRGGWAVLADLEEPRGPDEPAGLDEPAVRAGALARAEAIAAVCAWLGVSVLRTRHVAEIRRCADMTESILGRRPPAWAVRGLA
jgi:hypothetical protein